MRLTISVTYGMRLREKGACWVVPKLLARIKHTAILKALLILPFIVQELSILKSSLGYYVASFLTKSAVLCLCTLIQCK